MNSVFKCIYDTEEEAIKCATEDVKEWAKDNGKDSFAEVAKENGDILIIESNPNGEISESISNGLNKGSIIYMSKKAGKIFQKKEIKNILKRISI